MSFFPNTSRGRRRTPRRRRGRRTTTRRREAARHSRPRPNPLESEDYQYRQEGSCSSGYCSTPTRAYRTCLGPNTTRRLRSSPRTRNSGPDNCRRFSRARRCDHTGTRGGDPVRIMRQSFRRASTSDKAPNPERIMFVFAPARQRVVFQNRTHGPVVSAHRFREKRLVARPASLVVPEENGDCSGTSGVRNVPTVMFEIPERPDVVAPPAQHAARREDRAREMHADSQSFDGVRRRRLRGAIVYPNLKRGMHANRAEVDDVAREVSVHSTAQPRVAVSELTITVCTPASDLVATVVAVRGAQHRALEIVL